MGMFSWLGSFVSSQTPIKYWLEKNNFSFNRPQVFMQITQAKGDEDSSVFAFLISSNRAFL